MAAPTDYFADVSKTDLMRVVVALSGELFSLQDRLTVLEGVLAGQGIDLAALDAPAEAAADDAQRKAARDAFVARVFAALAAPDRAG